jgi:hypothetical protein
MAGCLGDPAGVGDEPAQRGLSSSVPPDTLRFQAVGQTAALPVSAKDQDNHQASSPPAVTGIVVADTAVAEPADSGRVRARGNGMTHVWFVTAEATRNAVIVVNQIPKSLRVGTTPANAVVMAPVGAVVPLSCQVLDAEQYPIPREYPVQVSSARGLVSGTLCGEVRVRGPGYDTLSFSLGSAHAQLPVIIAAAPDSVVVLATARPLSTVPRDSFVGENLTNPLILALRPLTADILAAYGNPTTNLGRARAIRDWVARTAIILDPAIHPDGSTSNLSVLPPGTSWADVNGLYSPEKWVEDWMYWDGQFYEGYAMLDRLLGTLDPGTGQRADDGMMEHVAGARYRIRDVQSYHYLLCTYQAIVATVLWEAVGLHAMRAAVLDHDPAAVFLPDLGRWVYEDATFDEDYLLDGEGAPLSPVNLLTLSTNGEADRLTATKLPGPTFDPQVYAESWTYMKAGHPNGMVIMGAQLYNRAVGARGQWAGRYVQIDVPALVNAPPPYSDPSVYARGTASEAFPGLGVVVQGVPEQDSVYVIQLSSTFPNHQHFERRWNGGGWESTPSVDVLPVGQCKVEYRSVDAVGNVGASAFLDVWLPRAPGFIAAGAPNGARRRSRYCS